MIKTSVFCVRLVTLGLVAGLCAFGTAWSQPGTVIKHQKISETVGNFTGVLDLSDEFGGSVATLGDLDGPGPSVVALAVGCYGDDDGGNDRGAVYVLFLDSNGAVLSHQKISDTQGNFTATMRNFDEFGSSVASLGDLDGPGPSAVALAVGAAFDDDGGTNGDRGSVYILFLNSAGSVLSYQKISDTQGNFTPTLDVADEFGGAVAWLGDLDGPGPSVATLAVGASGDDDGGVTDPATGRGAAYLLFLSSNGTILSHQKISSTSGGFAGLLDVEDEFAVHFADLGDLDGPGPSVAALVVGAAGDDDGGLDRGAFYILFLDNTGNVLSQRKISDTQGNFTAPLEDADDFGSSMAALGDLDGSGPSVATLAVGAPRDDDGGLVGANRGALYLFYLDRAGNILSEQTISDTQSAFSGILDDGDQFGAAMTSLGDIDGDGDPRQTVVSGTPFDDDGGGNQGSIYVLFLAGGAVTGVGDPQLDIAAHGLGQARPNPFRPETTIPFGIKESARVRIDICDIHGRIVRKLVDGTFDSGQHDASWDGSADSGRRLPAGAYFYRMSVNGRVETPARKTVLLK